MKQNTILYGPREMTNYQHYKFTLASGVHVHGAGNVPNPR